MLVLDYIGQVAERQGSRTHMETKKILFVVTMDDVGGPQNFIFHALKMLEGSAFQPLIAVGSEGGGALSRRLQQAGAPYVQLKSLRRAVNPVFDAKAVWELAALVRRERVDTLFLLSSKAGTIGTLAGRLARCPKIIYRIGGFSFLHPEFSSRWRRLFLLAEKSMGRWRDGMVVNSRFERDLALEHNIIPKEKITLLRNSFPVSEGALLSRAEARAWFGGHIGRDLAGERVVGTVARLSVQKNLSLFIESACLFLEKYGSATFVIIGSGPERARLQGLIQKNGLNQHVFLAGEIPEASRLLKAFDIFLLTSLFEGIPWSVLEAFAAEVPVVATDSGSLRELVIPEETGLLTPSVANDIASACAHILQQPELAFRLASQAKRVLQQDYGFHQARARLLSLLGW